MKRAVILVCLLVVPLVLFGAQPPAGHFAGNWQGAISVMGQELNIIVHFEMKAGALGGTIDIPQQNAVGLPLINIRTDGDKIHFELVAGPTVAVFDGVLKDGIVSGDFQQATVKATFRMSRAKDEEKKTDKAESVPYKQEEVTITNGPVTLAGTLTLPEGPGPFPAVVMITGSGSQNRDEEVFGFKPFRLIADHLTRNGVAVLRCDDRGIGGSKGDVASATTADFAGDVAAELAYLRGRKDIAAGKLGLIGHSEGGVIAPMVAAKDHGLAFIVMMSGPAVRGDKVIIEQSRLIAKADGESDQSVAENAAAEEKLLSMISGKAADKEIESFLASVIGKAYDRMPAEQRKAAGDRETFVKTQVKGQMAAVGSPWFRYFIAFEPAPILAQVKCPVLAFYGEKDLQVPTAQNAPVIQEIFRKSANRGLTIKIMPDANHLYEKAGNGSPTEYAKLDKVFVPGFLDTLSGWIKATIKQGRS